MDSFATLGMVLNFTQRLYTLQLCPMGLSDAIREKYVNRNNHKDDAGVDLYIPNKIVVPAGARGFLIDHLVAGKMFCKALASHRKRDSDGNLDLTDSFGATSYILVPRSSIVNTPLRMANSIGIIDSSYRGHLIAAVDNLSSEPFAIDDGTRLFQICAPGLTPLKLEVVDSLDETVRGSGGFGSTGK